MATAKYYVEVLIGEDGDTTWLSFDDYDVPINMHSTWRIRYRGKVIARWRDGKRVK